MTPLPPRPKNTSTPQQEPDDILSEKTRREQDGGRESIKLAEAKLIGEMEEGRRLVELNRRRAERKLTNDSEGDTK
jgi:hypothetical protein